MPERIYKLQPDRTVFLRGFDGFGAAAAIHTATPDSFAVSGVFRDAADFAVIVLYDADNFFEHPRLKYLPDTNFENLSLEFDLHYSAGLMPIDSPKYATVDWPYLDVIREDGSSAQIRLFQHATQMGGTYLKAEGRFNILDGGMKEYDRLTLWYLNYAFDYFVPKLECAWQFYAAGPGVVHWVNVEGVNYQYVEQAGDNSAAVAAGLAQALATCPHVTAWPGDGTPDGGPAHQLNLRTKPGSGEAVSVSASADPSPLTLYRVSAASVAAALAAQINTIDWEGLGVILPLEAESDGAGLIVRCARPGMDGNSITLHAVAKNSRLTTDVEVVRLAGGSSDATWRILLDFAALGVPRIRTMWLTLAPSLPCGEELGSVEWEATFSNWTVHGPDAVKALAVAGPNSLRVEESNPLCRFQGAWTLEDGFYSGGFAKRTSEPGASVVIEYASAFEHQLWIGAALGPEEGTAKISLDGDEETTLNCLLQTTEPVHTRRLVRERVPAGHHVVTIRLDSGQSFCFDYLEAAVPSDIPDPAPARVELCPALDYSTDHTYKLPPARILWALEQLGWDGPLNEYIGVFWWNQRRRRGGSLPSCQVAFGGEFVPGDQVFLNIGAQRAGKTVFPSETPSTIARHFAAFVNATYVGVWAVADGPLLTLRARSARPPYSFPVSAEIESRPGSTGSVQVNGSLTGGVEGEWEVDTEAPQPMNRAARDWHREFFRLCAQKNRELTVAASMELVLPPPEFAARFPDGTAVETDTGFASLRSTHCAFNTPVRAFQKTLYAFLAELMESAGLTPRLQFGEFLWWFFSNYSTENPSGGMAFYDDETRNAAQSALGRPLHVFISPEDDPSVNGGADAAFLRNRLRDHVAELAAYIRAAAPSAQLELLYPCDVNHPRPAGIHRLGGALNRFVNLPTEWESKNGSGLDALKIEALNFGAWSRDLDLVKESLEFARSLDWPPESLRYMAPVFRPGCAWTREVALALGLGYSSCNLWAFDHICLFGICSQEQESRTARRLG